MRHFAIAILWTAIGLQFIHAQAPSGYYDGCLTLSGAELKTCLHNVIKGHTVFPYTADDTDVWDILKESDRDPNNPDNVVLVYSGISTDAAQEYNFGKGWEREHVWSASHAPFERESTPGTDVHHLKPVHKRFNGSAGKSNRDFDECSMPVLFNGSGYDCFREQYAFEPRDAVKGDVARMLFYMAVRYEGEDGEPDLELVDNVNSSPSPEKPPHYGKLSTLLKWHLDDPVDEFEKNRNEVIFYFQKNRNPFIDHPELVNRIWP
jgi:endonuclease I